MKGDGTFVFDLECFSKVGKLYMEFAALANDHRDGRVERLRVDSGATLFRVGDKKYLFRYGQYDKSYEDDAKLFFVTATLSKESVSGEVYTDYDKGIVEVRSQHFDSECMYHASEEIIRIFS